MADQPETPEQRKARLDSVLPMGHPSHPRHEEWKARQQTHRPAHNLLLQILNQNEQQQDQPSVN